MDILEILGKLGFDWQVALANLVNFLIIFWILKRYAFGPIKKTLADRQAKIDTGLHQANEAQETLATAQAEADGVLREARSQAETIVQSARAQHQSVVATAEDDAKAKASTILEQAKRAAQAERQKMRETIQQEAVGLVAQSVRNIVSNHIDEKTAQQLAVQELKQA